MDPQKQQQLERLIGRTLRELPPRRAPSSLESRVQAEIARRAALPWWRKSFLHWPVQARAVFVVASAALVLLAVQALGWASGSIDATQIRTAVAADLHWLTFARSLLDAANESARAILGSISPVWIYGGLAMFVSLYLALFGIGAAAYRTLYSDR